MLPAGLFHGRWPSDAAGPEKAHIGEPRAASREPQHLAGPYRLGAGCEKGDQDIEQHGQAEAHQGKRDKADAYPKAVDRKLIRETGTNSGDDAAFTVFTKSVGHEFCLICRCVFFGSGAMG